MKKGNGKTAEAKQWGEAYAFRSGVSVQWLREHGREVRPCVCGEEDCEGWQMAHVGEGEWFAIRMSQLQGMEAEF